MTCRHHLGGGSCRMNLEAECAAGFYEAWEERAQQPTLAPRSPRGAGVDGRAAQGQGPHVAPRRPADAIQEQKR